MLIYLPGARVSVCQRKSWSIVEKTVTPSNQPIYQPSGTEVAVDKDTGQLVDKTTGEEVPLKEPATMFTPLGMGNSMGCE